MSASPTFRSPVLCRACGSTDNEVTDTRSVAWWVRRRRRCLSCGFAWRTYEMLVDPKKLRLKTRETYNP